MKPSSLHRMVSKTLVGFLFAFTLLISSHVQAAVFQEDSPGSGTYTVSGCGEAAAPGTYTLTQNIGTSSQSCLLISSSGVVLTSTGTTTINGDISNVGFTITFAGKVVNHGTVSGDALFTQNSSNTGTVSGNVEVFAPSPNPIGGKVNGFVGYHGYSNFPLNIPSFPLGNLLAYWKLSESASSTAQGGGDFFDLSGNGKNAAAYGNVVYGMLSDYGGTAAIKLNGVSSYVLSPRFNPSASVTLSAWIKPTSLGGVVFSELGQSTINTAWHDSQIEVETDGTVKMGVWTGSLRFINIGQVSFNTWHHVVLSYDAGTNLLTGYIDGVQGNSATFVRRAPDTGSVYYGIGAKDTTSGGNGNYFSGQVGDVGVWSRALSPSEVSQVFASYNKNSLYFNGAADGDWDNLSNWWQDVNFTVPALSIPVSGDIARLYASISSVTNSDAVSGTAIFYNANLGSNLLLTGNAIFKGSSENAGIVDGNANFEDTASNSGAVNGNADVYYSAQNPLGGTVSGVITYHGYVRTLYYNDQLGNGNWNSLGNWWNDKNYTSQAESLPANGDTVYIDGYESNGPLTSIALNKVIVGSIGKDAFYSSDAVNLSNVTSITSGVDFYNGSYPSFNTIINGNATFSGGSINYGTVNGNATFNDSSHNGGTVSGDVIFTAAQFDSNYIYGANPQLGTVGGRTIFSATTSPVTFTLRNRESWDGDPSSWIFATSGVNWIFRDHSYNTGTITTARFYDSSDMSGGTASSCLFYDSSTYSAGVGCGSTTYQRPFYFNNASSTNWNDLGNWWNNSSFTQAAVRLPQGGDVAYITSPLAVGPSAPVNLDRIYVGGENAWTSHPGAGNRWWSSIASSADGKNLAAVDRHSYVYTSTDYGVSWTQRTSSGSRSWQSIASSGDGRKLVAAVYSGKIYTSDDYGATWSERNYFQGWQSVASSYDGTKLVAVAYKGYIYTSNDSGQTWQVAYPNSNNWQSVASSYDGTRLVAVGDFDYIYTSDDSGQTWHRRDSAGLRQWYAVAESSDGSKIFAADEYGYIYTSSDAGETWVAQTSSAARDWYSIACSADGEKVIAGTARGSIYISGNAGQTWTEQTSTYGQYWASVASSADGTRVAATGNDYIYTSVIPTFSVDFTNASGDAYFYNNTVNTGTIHGTLHIFGNRLLSDVNHGTLLGGVEFNDYTSNDMVVIGDSVFNGVNRNIAEIIGDVVNNGVLSGNGTTTGAVINNGEINAGTFLNTVTNTAKSIGITGDVFNAKPMSFYGGSRIFHNASISGDGIFYATSSNSGSVLGNATFVGDFAENFYLSTNGFVAGVKTRLYDAADAQINIFRNFADTAWTIIADNTIVKLLYRNLIDLFGRNQNTTTTLVEQNNGFILRPLVPGVITTCGVLDTPNATYTLGTDISNYRFDTCFVVRANGVTLDGAGHSINAVSRAVSRYAVVATSTYSQDNTYNAFTGLTIKNITFSNFAYGVMANGGNNPSGAGGDGGNVTIATSTLNASIFANGGNGTGNGGNGGNISITETDVRGIGTSSVLSAKGGDTSSCGSKGGNGGSVETINSGYDLIYTDPGSGPQGCPSSTIGRAGGGHRDVGGNITPAERIAQAKKNNPLRNVSGSRSNAELQAPGLKNIFTVLPPVAKIEPIKLKELKKFGDSTKKDAFSFVPFVSTFLFDPIPDDVLKKMPPKILQYLSSRGITTAQKLLNLRKNPIVFTDQSEGVFTASIIPGIPIKQPGKDFSISRDMRVDTYLALDSKNAPYEIIRTYSGAKIYLSLNSRRNKIGGKFRGERIEFSDGDVEITAPSVPGSYPISADGALIPLVLQVSSRSAQTLSLHEEMGFWNKAIDWVFGKLMR